jgi:hypothetical protein
MRRDLEETLLHAAFLSKVQRLHLGAHLYLTGGLSPWGVTFPAGCSVFWCAFLCGQHRRGGSVVSVVFDPRRFVTQRGPNGFRVIFGT